MRPSCVLSQRPRLGKVQGIVNAICYRLCVSRVFNVREVCRLPLTWVSRHPIRSLYWWTPSRSLTLGSSRRLTSGVSGIGSLPRQGASPGSCGIGLENKLEAREPARARSGSARLGAAREPRTSRFFELVFATSRAEPARSSSRALQK